MRSASRSLRVVSIALVALSATTACATRPTAVEDLGDGVRAMTKRSTYFSGRADDLKIQVELEALTVCQSAGRALAVLDSRAIDPGPPAFPSATVRFRCVTS